MANLFGDLFGSGDMGNSIMQGMKIGMMQQQMKLEQQKMQQEEQLNKLKMEDYGLKIQAQRTLNDEAVKNRANWEGVKTPLMKILGPDMGEVVASGGRDIGMAVLPQVIKNMAPKEPKPINMPPWYDATGLKYYPDYLTNPDSQRAWAGQYSQMMNTPEGQKKLFSDISNITANTATPFYMMGGQVAPGQIGSWNARTGEMSPSRIPGNGSMTDRIQRPLPEKIEDKLTGSLDTLDMLETLEGLTKKISTGIPKVGGVVTAIKAYMGNDDAQLWRSVRDQLVANAQTIIKGIPSNFDVQTFIKTLPDASYTDAENMKRIRQSRRLLMNAVKTGIQNYDKSNLVIPDYIRERWNNNALKYDENTVDSTNVTEQQMKKWIKEGKSEQDIINLMKGDKRENQTNKTVVKKFVSPSTGKTKFVYSDGTEEVR